MTTVHPSHSIENRHSLSDTSWFTFREYDLQQAYDDYRAKEVSAKALLFVLVVSTGLQIYFSAFVSSSTHIELLTATRCIRVLLLLPGWALFARVVLSRRRPQITPVISTATLGNITILCFTISLCFVMIVRSIVGKCKEGEAPSNCNPDAHHDALPQETIISAILSVLACQAMIKCYHSWALFASWCISFLSILAAIVIASATRSFFSLIISIISGCVLYDYERNMLRMFIALRNSEASIRAQLHTENEKQVMEMRSVEMRHLLGNVAHDLKTPMQSFVMDLELVEKKLRSPLEHTFEYTSYAVSDMKSILEAVQHLIDTNSFMYMVVNRAIDYCHTTTHGALRPLLSTVHFSDSISWAINIVKSKSRVPIVLENISNNVADTIITDKQWLIENVLCLISNAVKFTMAGSVTVRCELIRASKNAFDVVIEEDIDDDDTSLSSGDELLIEVEDTGIGIPEEKRESMFQPFQQTMRMAGGTGLGLYSLRNRVEALKGSCGISDRRDGADGARIWFKIPYRPDLSGAIDDDIIIGCRTRSSTRLSRIISERNNRQDDSNSQVLDLELSASSAQSRVKILVVDDSLTIRKSISRVLVNEGLIVDLAENGQMALEMMGLKRYDLVLMDLQMPVMDGLEAVRRLRKQESESGDEYHQKVIGISAYTGEPYCSDAINAGMDGFIEKPFSAKRFMELCKEYDISS